jgi:hypothetical protein
VNEHFKLYFKFQALSQRHFLEVRRWAPPPPPKQTQKHNRTIIVRRYALRGMEWGDLIAYLLEAARSIVVFFSLPASLLIE